jgi:streptogramin lyase
MKSFRWATVLAVVFLTACSSSTSTSPASQPATTFNKLYITQFISSGNQLLIYKPPFSNTSAPTLMTTVTTTAGETGGITFNNSGTAFITDCCDPTDIEVFPKGTFASGTSTPKFDPTLTGTVNVYNTVDLHGNLWYSDRGTDTIGMIPSPINNSSVPTLTLTTPCDPAQISFDKSGDMGVACETGQELLFYTAPITASSTPSAVIPLGTDGQGVTFDKAGNMYATLFGSSGINVYNPPFSNTSTPAFTIPSGSTPQNIVFDSHGNLWDTDGVPEAQEWSPPFSATSTPAVTITSGITASETSLGFGP